MRLIWTFVFVFVIVVNKETMPAYIDEFINLGHFNIEKIDAMLANHIYDKSKRIEEISSAFKGIPYNDKTLIGSMKSKEVLVVNLNEVDCFTFIDYVEAMSKSSNFQEFKSNLKTVRYRDGIVDFQNRRHFFTDWAYDKDAHARDVTKLIAEDKAITTKKVLNKKTNRRFYLKGLPVVSRDITYIPNDAVNKTLINRLKTGDYIGIYSHEQGLDVSHVGVFIRDKDGRMFFRHASSSKGKVVEQSFLSYIKNRPGIVVLRTTE